jgi:hypothetical protein
MSPFQIRYDGDTASQRSAAEVEEVVLGFQADLPKKLNLKVSLDFPELQGSRFRMASLRGRV